MIMCLIHNISIATADDVTYFGDDVNYILCFLPRAITIWGYCLNWLEKTIVSGQKFYQFVVNRFGNSSMATEYIVFKFNFLLTAKIIFTSDK